MKILKILICLLMVGCSSPSHVIENPYQIGIDFSSGKWLLNTIDAPPDIITKLQEKVIKDFTKKLSNRFTYYPESTNLLIPQKIKTQPNKSLLKAIHTSTNYDFLINFKAGKIEPNMSIKASLQPGQNSIFNNKSGYVVMEIYDLKSEEIIYSQKVIASVNHSIKNNDVNISESINNLIIFAYKRLFDHLEKKSTL